MVNLLIFKSNLILLIGNMIAIIPLLIYLALFDKKEDGAWLGIFGKK